MGPWVLINARWYKQVEPVRKEQDAHKQETVEQRVGLQELAGNWRSAALVVNAPLADIAEDHTQHDRQRHEWVDDAPNRAVRTGFAGSVIQRLDNHMDCDHGSDHDEHHADDTPKYIHELLPRSSSPILHLPLFHVEAILKANRSL